jgi:hypothetical protein
MDLIFLTVFKQNHRKAIRTFDKVENVNIPALHLIFLQIIEKVSMFTTNNNRKIKELNIIIN